jgi:hypothetical protein
MEFLRNGHHRGLATFHCHNKKNCSEQENIFSTPLGDWRTAMMFAKGCRGQCILGKKEDVIFLTVS